MTQTVIGNRLILDGDLESSGRGLEFTEFLAPSEVLPKTLYWLKNILRNRPPLQMHTRLPRIGQIKQIKSAEEKD